MFVRLKSRGPMLLPNFMLLVKNMAEELSSIVGSAFRMAYAQQLQHPRQLEPRPARRRSPGAVQLGPPGLHVTCRDDRSPKPAARACWAKKAVGKAKHSDSSTNQVMDLNNRAYPSNISECCNAECAQFAPMNDSRSNRSTPNNLPLDPWSPSCGSSSCEENNSPTDVNSCKQIRDKPALQKNLEEVKENVLGAVGFSKDGHRPASSGAYGSEVDGWNHSQLFTPRYTSSCKGEGFSRHKKYSHGHRNHGPTDPSTDDVNILGMPSDRISKRSSRSSCDPSMPSLSSSLSDTNALGEQSDASSCCKSKRLNHNGGAVGGIPPTPPERYDSLDMAKDEEKDLREAAWFQAGIPREIALEVLSQEPVGAFMVRESTTKPGCFALSLRVPRELHMAGIAHYLIMQTNRGYKIKGFTKEFGTLSALITHHSVMPELLPCTLSLNRYNPSFRKEDSEDMVDMNEDPDYKRLSEFQKVIAFIKKYLLCYV
ncbi:tensin-4 [Trichonephila inaurata madagascariensis]|uniref:Tensin-4 n=1 Tax=Trichonephila inaurata madagascariensis TaxID=2747483 RepID=A0A8X6YJV0_9ARAC|nr:tensin-4 [Trichonephila inaurata madagascariensis]